MRVIRGLAALAVLVLGIVGVPWLLVALTTSLQPALAPLADPATLLESPDPLAIVIVLLLAVAWVAWLIFLVGVLAELVDVLSGRRLRIRLPGIAPAQRLTAGLVVSVVAMLSTSPLSTADPGPTGPRTTAAEATNNGTTDAHRAGSAAADTSAHSTAASPDHATAQHTARTPTHDPGSGRKPDDVHVHVVGRGDDLWSLAQQYFGRGSDWRRIAAANPERLTGGPDRLEAGWRLRIPGVERSESTANPEEGSRRRSADPGEGEERTVMVRRGDTLSAIAERFYGAERRWPVLWRANRHQLHDPDELLIGMRLVVPNLDEKSEEKSEEKSGAKSGGKSGEKSETESGAGGPAPSADRSDAQRNRADADRPGRQERTESRAGESTAQPDRPEPGSSGCELAAPPDASASPPPQIPPPQAPAQPPPPAPEPPAPEPPAPGAPAPAPPPDQGPFPQTQAEAPESSAASPAQSGAVVAGLAGVGALLAASLIGGLAFRRRTQLQSRPVGRRILHPTEGARAAEVVLSRRAGPLGLRALDLATRAISASCHAAASPLPCLTVATVGDKHVELHWTEPADPPPGFRATANRWTLAAADLDYLRSVPGLDEAVRPYPALVTLGLDAKRQPVVADLETLGLLRLQAEEPALIESALTAMAVELSFSPWAEEMILTLVGSLPHLPAALGKHNVSHTDDVDGLLERLEARAAVQREQSAYEVPGQHRVDPDLADPWAPEIVLINRALPADHRARLQALLTAEPRVTMAAVLPGSTGEVEGGWTLRLERGETSRATGLLEPLGWPLAPQLIEEPAAAAVVELITVTGSDATTPAPWWTDPDPPPDNVTYLGKRFGGWATHPNGNEAGADDMIRGHADGEGGLALHPTLRLLGPIELVGAAGPAPPRAAKQCLEYCGWLLEHPGASARAMAASLVVAEGTRRSNMSRLRVWLGSADDGSPYLPDAYSGRIRLHGAVSSDWQRLQILTAAGVNLARTSGLEAALHLVRGAPLADAAPGQWYWAEELRTDMISAVRDIGVELTNRALNENNIDLARWAAARALVAAPGDELLLVARIRTEHQAGNRGEVERLTLQVAAHARQLGVDLAAETVSLLQEVMEGRVRARMA
jgi:nucleoid-associated protein YgaU